MFSCVHHLVLNFVCKPFVAGQVVYRRCTHTFLHCNDDDDDEGRESEKQELKDGKSLHIPERN